VVVPSAVVGSGYTVERLVSHAREAARLYDVAVVHIGINNISRGQAVSAIIGEFRQPFEAITKESDRS
jgi:hypothetical protein